ncbi:MAG: hypothetical protein ACRYHA_01780 [Janthinobacterium lividum]
MCLSIGVRDPARASNACADATVMPKYIAVSERRIFGCPVLDRAFAR